MLHTRFTREVHAYGALHLPKREEKITVLQSNSVYVLHRPFFQSYLLYLRFFFNQSHDMVFACDGQPSVQFHLPRKYSQIAEENIRGSARYISSLSDYFGASMVINSRNSHALLDFVCIMV